MAFGNSTFAHLSGAVGDILGGKATAEGLRLKARGNLAEAENYDLASDLALQNKEFTRESTDVKVTQAQRELYLGIGRTEADLGGAGLATSGTAIDLLRDSARWGALTKQILGRQGLIQEAGYQEQATAYTNMAKAARDAAATQDSMAGDAERNGWITGGIKGVAAIASLFT